MLSDYNSQNSQNSNNFANSLQNTMNAIEKHINDTNHNGWYYPNKMGF